MRKVLISVSDCQSGMKMAETIFNEYGAVIVAENTILDNHLIRKLDNLGFLRVKIYDQSEQVIINNDTEAFKMQYNVNIEIVKDVLHEISIGKNLNENTVNIVSESIYSRINENRDIVSCINQIRNVDEYTYTHSVNVSLLSMLIGKWMKLDLRKIKLLVQSGLLHDVGKTRVASDILNKPGLLSEEEFEEMKKHPVLGYRIVETAHGINKEIGLGVLMHHEREDGSGYPMGLKGDRIHLFAKIISVADIYDAMTSDRIYRLKESPFEVFELMENKTFGMLDPRVISSFLNNIAAYYIGDYVRLNNNEVGEIVYINPRHISQPLIKVGSKFVDLTLEKDIKIVELL